MEKRIGKPYSNGLKGIGPKVAYIHEQPSLKRPLDGYVQFDFVIDHKISSRIAILFTANFVGFAVGFGAVGLDAVSSRRLARRREQ